VGKGPSTDESKKKGPPAKKKAATPRSSTTSAAPRASAGGGAKRAELQRSRLDAQSERRAEALHDDAGERDAQMAIKRLPKVPLPLLQTVKVVVDDLKTARLIPDHEVQARARAKREQQGTRVPRGRGDLVGEGDVVIVTRVGFAGGKVRPRSAESGVLLDELADPGGRVRAALVGCPVGESRVVQAGGPFAVRVDQAFAIEGAPPVDASIVDAARVDAAKATRAARLVTLERRVLDAVIAASRVNVPKDVEDTLLRAWWSARERPALVSMGIVGEELALCERAWLDDEVLRSEARREIAVAKVVEAAIVEKKITVVEDDERNFLLHLHERTGAPLVKMAEGLAADPATLRKFRENLLVMKAVEVLTRAVVGDALVDELRGKRAA